jgi:uncharacterized protein
MTNASDDAYDITHSPLERTLSGEGHTLRIDIYKGLDEPDWVLEIEDEEGTSTVFDERFATDQAALEAALSTIEAEGGIHRFCVNAQAEAKASEAEFFAQLGELERATSAVNAPAPHHMLEPLNDDQLNELDRLLLMLDADQGMTLDTLNGFLHAIAIGPETVMPSQWLPLVWRLEDGSMMPPMDSPQQVNHLLGLIMRHYNSIIAGLEQFPPVFAPMWTILEHNGTEAEDAQDWAHGFTEGVKLSQAAWQLLGDEDAPPEWDDLIRTPEQRAALTADIEESVLEMHDYWLPLRQAVAERRMAQAMTAKVGRNEHCPCGSGKKYKKCCGSPVTLH